MAGKKSLKKYPKKPKASANIATMERYLEKCKEVDKTNKPIVAHNKKVEELRKKVINHK